MNITKEQADKVIAALEDSRSQVVVYGQDYHPGLESVVLEDIDEALTIMRGLADAEPVARVAEVHMSRYTLEWLNGPLPEGTELYTSPQAAQTALKSESSAQAAQAPARLPSEGKPIEALAPVEIKPGVLYELKPGGVHVFKAQTEAALREVVRLSEDAGLYDSDFQAGRAGRKG